MVADVIVFPNSATPEQREECARCMGTLETLANGWAKEIDLTTMAKNIADISRKLPAHMPPKVRAGFIDRQQGLIYRMVEQAWIEGALAGCTGAFDAVRAGYVPK